MLWKGALFVLVEQGEEPVLPAQRKGHGAFLVGGEGSWSRMKETIRALRGLKEGGKKAWAMNAAEHGKRREGEKKGIS